MLPCDLEELFIHPVQTLLMTFSELFRTSYSRLSKPWKAWSIGCVCLAETPSGCGPGIQQGLAYLAANR